MDIPLREIGVYSFGPFRLDPLRRALWRGEVQIKLAERVFNALLYLVVNHGRLVERDELLQAIWRGRHVDENNLAQAIVALRRALQAEDPAETYIVTAAGRGYRFAAPVVFEPALDVIPAMATLHAPEALSASPAATHAPRLRAALAAPLLAAPLLAALVLIVCGSTIWHFLPPAPPPVEAFVPPPHSVAVLAFTNMSGDAGQDYFSDGLSEQLIDTLSRIDGLQVAARTSSFSFKGGHATVGEIARALNVAAVLEGSVRRDGKRMRVTAQLIYARTGYHFWSKTFDRDIGDVFDMQVDIARAVSDSLRATLLGEDAAQLMAGSTRVPQAFDAYLRAMSNAQALDDAHDNAAIADFDQAIELDPGYAAAYAGRAMALNRRVTGGTVDDVAQSAKTLAAAFSDADRAIALAPDFAEGHRVRGFILQTAMDFDASLRELAHAVALAPGNAKVSWTYGLVEASMGHFETGLAALRRAVTLDPVNPRPYRNLANALYYARRFDEAERAFQRADALESHPSGPKLAMEANLHLAEGNPQAAVKICASGESWADAQCLAIAYHALGQPAKAAAQLAQLQKSLGDHGAYNYADVYAQWGETAQALHWLETAYALHDSGLSEMRTDPFLDPIRNTAIFKDIEEKLHFPP
jgi:TolB-like protein/DNA-binding winged helix-turn-helix (wHTH) protein/Tfp pilus assembly protein PilF